MISLALLILSLHAGHPQMPRHHRHPTRHPREVCPGATHFYEKHHPAPYWAKNMVVVCVVQNHIFLREQTPAERRHATLVVMENSHR